MYYEIHFSLLNKNNYFFILGALANLLARNKSKLNEDSLNHASLEAVQLLTQKKNGKMTEFDD